MGPTPEEFSELRRLLALKRREQPPPGYFNTFVGKVIARIEAEGLAQPRPWWVRLFSPLEWSPGLAGANTAIFAGLAILGGTALFLKGRPERNSQTPSPHPAPQPGLDTVEAPTTPLTNQQFAGFIPENLLGSVRDGLVQMQPAPHFRFRRPSVRERVERLDDDQIPPGIFEPWNHPTVAFPTSIVHFVESPR